MDGVLDHTLRRLLSRYGGIDRCVTEFLRVTDQLLPRRAFYRLCPELHQGGHTDSGVPVWLQLLGGQAEPLALNAVRAIELGAPGVDLNFGCPARTVNRHDGGAILLREPERIHRLVAAVRHAVPAAFPVSVKIRLGFDDSAGLIDLVQAVCEAGASELAIHARTRTDGYRPPARWHQVAPAAAVATVPLFINGDITSIDTAARAQAHSGCHHLMVGRGALIWPDLPRRLHAAMHHPGAIPRAMGWPDILPLLQELLAQTLLHYDHRHAGNPIKQWLGYLRGDHPEAALLFEGIKRLTDPAALEQALTEAGRVASSREQGLAGQSCRGA